MAYSSSKIVTIDNTKVSGSSNLSNFRFLFKSTANYLRTTGNGGDVTSASGFDIIFSSDSNPANKLAHEIVHYDPATGQFIAWVLIPTVSHNTDTNIHLLFGDSGVTTSQEDKSSLWSGYAGVWHLKENPAGVSGEIKDSTSNANHGTGTAYPSTGTLPSQVDGKIYKAVQPYKGGSTGQTGYVIVADDPDLDMGTGDYSISMWVKSADWNPAVTPYFVSKLSNTHGYAIATQGSENKLRMRLGAGTVTNFVMTDNHSLLDNDWAKIKITVDRDGNIIFYINGVQIGSGVANTIGNSIDTEFNLAFGTNSAGLENPGLVLDGAIEEVRIIKSILSADEEATEYNNQNDPSNFYTVSDVGATTTTTTTTTSTTTTTTTMEILDSQGAIVYGHETPTNGELSVSWGTWRDGAGGQAVVSGDADWGKIALNTNDEARSQVRELPDAQARVFSLTQNEYGSGQGTATVQIRGHASVKPGVMDVSPSWENYTVPVEKAWKYIQVRVIKEA